MMKAKKDSIFTNLLTRWSNTWEIPAAKRRKSFHSMYRNNYYRNTAATVPSEERQSWITNSYIQLYVTRILYGYKETNRLPRLAPSCSHLPHCQNPTCCWGRCQYQPAIRPCVLRANLIGENQPTRLAGVHARLFVRGRPGRRQRGTEGCAGWSRRRRYCSAGPTIEKGKYTISCSIQC